MRDNWNLFCLLSLFSFLNCLVFGFEVGIFQRVLGVWCHGMKYYGRDRESVGRVTLTKKSWFKKDAEKPLPLYNVHSRRENQYKSWQARPHVMA